MLKRICLALCEYLPLTDYVSDGNEAYFKSVERLLVSNSAALLES